MQIESLNDIWEAICLELKKKMTEQMVKQIKKILKKEKIN